MLTQVSPCSSFRVRKTRIALLVALLVAGYGCGDDGPGLDGSMGDSATDAASDSGTMCPPLPEIEFAEASIGATVGVTRTITLALRSDFPCPSAPRTATLTRGTPGVIDIPDTVEVGAEGTHTTVMVTALAEGQTTVTAEWTFGGDVRTATFDAFVTDGSIPTCEGSASGTLGPGTTLAIDGGPASGAGVALQAEASLDGPYQVAPFDAQVSCGSALSVEGTTALGPAISFGPSYVRLGREIPFAIPIKSALLAEGAHVGHVAVAYSEDGATDARVVPVTDKYISGTPASGLLHFVAPRLGTFQAVVANDAPVTRDRLLTYRGITGVSMGGGGSALIGLRHPERFDLLAPLGGPVDWIYLVEYIRRYYLGGFCTDAERTAGMDCGGADASRRGEPLLLHEVAQDFEHWFFDERSLNLGGTFDRRQFIRAFRDVSMMYGNLNTSRADDPSAQNVTAPGVPDSRRMLSDAARCDDPIIIPPCEGTFPSCAAGTGYVDDEYNPVGAYPAITVCDGGELSVDGETDHGVWDPSAPQFFPFEVALAVDVNENAVRDPGEPVIRSVREPFDDCGLDTLCDVDEPGYDALTNPDPNGDDYDAQFRPLGTEGNWLRDSIDGDPCTAEGESFLDAGLDGVIGTVPSANGGFDTGEGNGCWDVAGGFARLLSRNPRSMVLTAPDALLRDIDVFTDGGIRDHFQFGVATAQFAGAFTARGHLVNAFNSHTALAFEGGGADDRFVFTDVPWKKIGKYVMVRYGKPDGTTADIMRGDGDHVGTPEQIVSRLLSVISWMSARWPGGDRSRVNDRICPEVSSTCPHVNQFAFDFTSQATGRTGEVTIVLPPGYYMEEFQDMRYPVVYFGHGYGQEPADLLPTGVLIWNQMIAPTIPESERVQKMIFVFPDGSCHPGECLKGTFFADAPPQTGGPQMETFMLDLMDYVDDTYRTKVPETVEVTE